MSGDRVAYLESQCNQLSEQIRTMKTLVATEVSDLKSIMQQQVGEIKQIVMHQDKLYNERLRRLESRMEQMSDFTLQLARASGTTGAIYQLPSMNEAAAIGGEAAGTRSTGGEGGGFDDYEDEFAGSAAWVRYKDKFDAIFTYYTTSNIKVFNSNCNLPCFVKMLKDCNIGGFNSGTTPEILWMAVLRRLEAGKHRRKKVSTFAFERLGEIPRQNFGEAIYHLAQETVGKADPSLTPDEAFETFIARDFFPAVDDRMKYGQTTLRSTADPLGSSGVEDYKTPAVKAIVKEYLSRLKESFNQSIQSAQNWGDINMKLEGFVEFVRRGNLFSMISKPDINQIFSAIAAIEAEKNPTAPAGTITMPALMLGLYHLAERIYGDNLYADKYPDPESRIKKLLAKMYLLA